MDKYITMSQKELKRYEIITKLINEEINGTQASNALKFTVRHVRRLKKQVKKYGVKGIIHGNRGKDSNRKIPEKEQKRIKQLLHEKYSDFGPTFASEKLTEKHGIKRDTKTIRTIMIKEELWVPKRKKKDKHRQWRQRKANYGEMIQYDGSYEYWFEDRGEKCCLLASIDDATGMIWMRFDKHEGVVPTFNFWREYVKRFGKPFSIYVDRFSTYSMNHKLAKENPDTLTQFQRAMETGLNVEIIHARSAQGKGRVERLFLTLQDRLIKELRLNNISTIEGGNRFLEKKFLFNFNTKFMVEPRSKANFHKKLTPLETNKLDSIFSKQTKRTVMNDFTINHDKKWYQLIEEQPVTICKRDKVIVEDRLDSTVCLQLRGKYLNYELLPEKPTRLNSSRKEKSWVIAKTIPHKPSANHPWRKFNIINYHKN